MWLQHLGHLSHKSVRGVGKPNQHYELLKEPIKCFEGGLPSIQSEDLRKIEGKTRPKVVFGYEEMKESERNSSVNYFLGNTINCIEMDEIY